MKATNKDNLPATRRACGKCGLLGHLQRTCKGAEKAHIKVGVEVEGYWKEDRWDDVRRVADKWHMSGTTDGSLGEHANYKAYEWRTRPGSLGEAISQLLAVYPDGTDDKCGMHVHVSFTPGDVMALACPEFFAYFAREWSTWGTKHGILRSSEFWARLSGQNHYCKLPSLPSASMLHRLTSMDRYSQLNFSSWRKGFGTLECRMLPMFKHAQLGVLALEELIRIYETWLNGEGAEAIARMSTKVALPSEAGTVTDTLELEREVPGVLASTTEAGTALYPDAPPQDGYVRVHGMTGVNRYASNAYYLGSI